MITWSGELPENLQITRKLCCLFVGFGLIHEDKVQEGNSWETMFIHVFPINNRTSHLNTLLPPCVFRGQTVVFHLFPRGVPCRKMPSMGVAHPKALTLQRSHLGAGDGEGLKVKCAQLKGLELRTCQILGKTWHAASHPQFSLMIFR